MAVFCMAPSRRHCPLAPFGSASGGAFSFHSNPSECLQVRTAAFKFNEGIWTPFKISRVILASEEGALSRRVGRLRESRPLLLSRYYKNQISIQEGTVLMSE